VGTKRVRAEDMFEAISVKGSSNQHNRFGLSRTEEDSVAAA